MPLHPLAQKKYFNLKIFWKQNMIFSKKLEEIYNAWLQVKQL